MYIDEEGRQCFDYTGAVEGPINVPSGSFIECWGPQGGRADAGFGAYTCGMISETATIYLVVGQRGRNVLSLTPLFSGASGLRQGPIDAGGGGASDIRLVGGSWSNTKGLRSRIMVAAGGAAGLNSLPGVGGTLQGFNGDRGDGTYCPGYCGTQTSGGAVASASGHVGGTGGFGFGGWGLGIYGGGGSAGYYGGSGGVHQAGGSGSSFISGYEGCNAISENGTHTGQSVHYSGIYFKKAVMLSGNEEMPNPRGAGTIKGNFGHGFIRITPPPPIWILVQTSKGLQKYNKSTKLWTTL